jgi:hypothetical protein
MWDSRRSHGEAKPPDCEEPIVFLDIERNLKKPPDILADNRHLPIRAGVVDTVVYDPPHWNFGTSEFHGDPQEKKGSFWGNFKNKRTLHRLLAGASRETLRALRPEGRLLLKWCEARFTWPEVSSFFIWGFDVEWIREWQSRSNRSKTKTMWVCLRPRESR